MKRRERRTFTKEFKHQMVQLYLSGKPANEITEEYDRRTNPLTRLSRFLFRNLSNAKKRGYRKSEK